MENKEKKCLECGKSIPDTPLNYCAECIYEMTKIPPPAELEQMFENIMAEIDAKIAEYKAKGRK